MAGPKISAPIYDFKETLRSVYLHRSLQPLTDHLQCLLVLSGKDHQTHLRHYTPFE